MSDSGKDAAQAARARIIARAWSDPAFKAELLADPHKVLTAAGIALKPGVMIKVVENTDSLHHLVLPPKPSGELNDVELDKVAGGTLPGMVDRMIVASDPGAYQEVLNQSLE